LLFAPLSGGNKKTKAIDRRLFEDHVAAANCHMVFFSILFSFFIPLAPFLVPKQSSDINEAINDGIGIFKNATRD